MLAPTQDQITVRVFGNDSLETLQTDGGRRPEGRRRHGRRGERAASPRRRPSRRWRSRSTWRRPRRSGSSPATSVAPRRRMLSGLRVGNLFEDQKVFDVVVWSTPDTRSSLSGVEGLLIDTPDGGHVRLGDVATVRVRATPPVIEHRRHLALRRRHGQRQGPQRRQGGRPGEGAAHGRRLPGRVPRRAAGRLLPRAGRAAAHPRLRPRCRARHLPAAAGRVHELAGGHASPSGRWSSPSRAACSRRGSTAVRSRSPPSPACSPCSGSPCARAWPSSTGTGGCGPRRAWRSAPTW